MENTSLGIQFESKFLIRAIFLVLNQPCPISNSFSSALSMSYAKSNFSVCNPLDAYPKVFEEGTDTDNIRQPVPSEDKTGLKRAHKTVLIEEPNLDTKKTHGRP